MKNLKVPDDRGWLAKVVKSIFIVVNQCTTSFTTQKQKQLGIAWKSKSCMQLLLVGSYSEKLSVI